MLGSGLVSVVAGVDADARFCVLWEGFIFGKLSGSSGSLLSVLYRESILSCRR